MSSAIEWIEDGVWSGWVEDLETGKVTTAEGDTFQDVGELKRLLSQLPYWPRPDRTGQRRIPKKREGDE